MLTGVDGAGCAVLSLDNYNDASRLIDGNFDGEGHLNGISPRF